MQVHGHQNFTPGRDKLLHGAPDPFVFHGFGQDFQGKSCLDGIEPGKRKFVDIALTGFLLLIVLRVRAQMPADSQNFPLGKGFNDGVLVFKEVVEVPTLMPSSRAMSAMETL